MEWSEKLGWLAEDPLLDLKQLKLARLQAGVPVYDLSMINPDLPPPRFALDKLMEAAGQSEAHRYAVSRGIRKLRAAFAVKYASAFGVQLDVESQVCATLGNKDALWQALSCLDPKAGAVLVGRPVYPAYLAALHLHGLSYQYFELQSNEDAMLSDITKQLLGGKIQLLLLNFPNNPTGISVSRSFYEKLAEVARKSKVLVINDFVYGELDFTTDCAPSLLSVPYFQSMGGEFYSLSKAYSVPGWRVGAVLGSAELISWVVRIKAQVDYGLFLPIQVAAAAVLAATADLVEPQRTRYHQRCELVSGELQQYGWEICKPTAGCSLWAKPPGIDQRGASSWCLDVLRQTGIVLLPGEVFGPIYRDMVRLALVLPLECLREVAIELGQFGGRRR